MTSLLLYELVIPKDNLLRQIKELVDFGFIYNELLDKYCLNNGRVRIFKYLLLKSIYDLSNADVAERSKYDMAFKYFGGHGARRSCCQSKFTNEIPQAAFKKYEPFRHAGCKNCSDCIRKRNNKVIKAT